MPQIGWTLDKEEIDEEGNTKPVRHFVPIEEAERVAREEGSFEDLPLAYLLAAKDELRPAGWVSPSMAGGCLRQKFLMIESEYYLDLESTIARIMGSGYHNVMESMLEQDTDDMLLEERITVPTAYEGVELSGQVDAYNRTHKRLSDYKTTGSFYFSTPPDPKHVMQLNIYLYLLRQRGETPEQAQLYYIVPKKVKRAEGKRKVDRVAVDIPIWEDYEVEEVINRMAAQIYAYSQDGTLPLPIHPESADYWQCGVCPVSTTCANREG